MSAAVGLARPLIAGVLATLAGGAGVSALAGARVYDAAPGGAVFPYLAVGAWTATAWNAGGADGASVVFALNAFARESRDAALGLIEAAVWALDAEPIALDGVHLVGLLFQDGATVLEKDRLTWRGTARFRALVEPG